MGFGISARRMREDIGWTRDDMLAQLEKIGSPMMVTTLQRIETEKQEPKLSEAIAIARVLDKTVDELTKSGQQKSLAVETEEALSRASLVIDQFQALIDKAAGGAMTLEIFEIPGKLKDLDKDALIKSFEHLEHITAVLNWQQYNLETGSDGRTALTVANIVRWLEPFKPAQNN